jgi:hypothetical protein
MGGTFQALLMVRGEQVIPFSAVSLLLHMNGADGSTTFTDSSSYATNPSHIFSWPKISSTSPKFGNGCGSFGVTGAGDNGYLDRSYVSYLDFSSGNFTVQYWFRSTNSAQVSRRMISFCKAGPSAAADFQYTIAINSGGTLYASVYSGSTGYTVGSALWSTYADGNWHFLELCRIGNDFFMLIDGSVIGSITQSITLNTNAAWLLEIGAIQPSVSQPYSGYFDDMRLIKGYGLKYTSVPTAQFSDSSVNPTGG